MPSSSATVATAPRPLHARAIGATDIVPVRLRSTHRPLRRLAAAVATVVVGAALGLSLSAPSVGADGPVLGDTHVVRSGDTLWALAGERTNPGDDVRATVADILHRNDLGTAELRVGQTLTLPPLP